MVDYTRWTSGSQYWWPRAEILKSSLSRHVHNLGEHIERDTASATLGKESIDPFGILSFPTTLEESRFC